MKAKEPRVFGVFDKDGKLTKLVEADSKAQVKAHLLNGVSIEVASALTVARADMEVEKAGG